MQHESIQATILATLVGWLITNVVSFFVRRGRLRAALLADIMLNVAGANEQRATLAKLITNQVIAGRTIAFPIFYNVGEYLLYKAIQQDLPKYLRKSELVKVVKFYQALWTLDVS